LASRIEASLGAWNVDRKDAAIVNPLLDGFCDFFRTFRKAGYLSSCMRAKGTGLTLGRGFASRIESPYLRRRANSACNFIALSVLE
jgi:hypothetical protein